MRCSKCVFYDNVCVHTLNDYNFDVCWNMINVETLDVEFV